MGQSFFWSSFTTEEPEAFLLVLNQSSVSAKQSAFMVALAKRRGSGKQVHCLSLSTPSLCKVNCRGLSFAKYHTCCALSAKQILLPPQVLLPHTKSDGGSLPYVWFPPSPIQKRALLLPRSCTPLGVITVMPSSVRILLHTSMEIKIFLQVRIYGSHWGFLKDHPYFTSIMTLVIGMNFPVLQMWLKVCSSLRMKVEHATTAFSATETK